MVCEDLLVNILNVLQQQTLDRTLFLKAVLYQVLIWIFKKLWQSYDSIVTDRKNFFALKKTIYFLQQEHFPNNVVRNSRKQITTYFCILHRPDRLIVLKGLAGFVENNPLVILFVIVFPFNIIDDSLLDLDILNKLEKLWVKVVESVGWLYLRKLILDM